MGLAMRCVLTPLAQLALLALLRGSGARPAYPAMLPNGDASTRNDSGITCQRLGHMGCTPPTNNKFGTDFKAANYNWTTAFCMTDSDGDGQTNGEELGDPCCEWTALNKTAAPSRKRNLSHPGESGQTSQGNVTCAALRAARAAPSASDLVPNGNASARNDSGITCARLEYVACALPATNQFGKDFIAANYSWTAALCMKDSDGDGQTNGEELGDPCCEWSASNATAAPARAMNLSHPGVPVQMSPGNVTCAALRAARARRASVATTTGEACFPGRATVRTRTRGRVRMDALRLGDEVAVGRGAWSPVFLFTHRRARVRAPFVRIATRAGGALQASHGHLLYAGGRLVKAGDVRPGDELDAAGEPDKVASVHDVWDTGLYNPHTLHGDIVVDGVRCSTFTAAVAPAPASAALAPFRAAFAALGAQVQAFEDGVRSTFGL